MGADYMANCPKCGSRMKGDTCSKCGYGYPGDGDVKHPKVDHHGHVAGKGRDPDGDGD